MNNIYLLPTPKSSHYLNRYIKLISYFKNKNEHFDVQHHILPRSMGGSDLSENLVGLSHRVHLMAHHLLWRSYENLEMTRAFWFMSHLEKDGQWIKINPRTYQKLRDDNLGFFTEMGRVHMTNMWANNREFMIGQLTNSWTSERRDSISGDKNPSKLPNSRNNISKSNSGRKVIKWTKNGVEMMKRIDPSELCAYLIDGWEEGHLDSTKPPVHIGKNHPRVKPYIFTNPSGERFYVDYSISQFCREQGIDRTAFYSVSLNGTVSSGKVAGWKIEPNF